MNTHTSHTKAIRAQLLAAMRTGEYAQQERLPRESGSRLFAGSLLKKLLQNIDGAGAAAELDQLRDILASLEREGFITRRHGVGTIINRHVRFRSSSV